ncbi:hypothetical protein CPLU01_04614 [Colletotrichum plurivorum]|uniref:Uncharacterized protein n=1 Tax=Colletotrichum plurivorum TaxID=2175906 RepID=A0A8H6KNT3_9PEZI|nr:hypothetical protein CPLU01_04614 [Colletotrichum plurivorum]
MPPLSPVPQDQPLADGRVIQPKDMRAITVNKTPRSSRKTCRATVSSQPSIRAGSVTESVTPRVWWGMSRVSYLTTMGGFRPEANSCPVAMHQSDFDVGELHGLRVERPPCEEAESTRREWLRYQVVAEGRSMSVFHTRSRVMLVKGHARFAVMVRMNSGVECKLDYILDELNPAPPVGSAVIVSIHAMDDGKPHPRPWYRSPLHGVWDNSHELHSFSVTVEWCDEATKKWFSAAFQHVEIFSHVNIQSSSDTLHASWGGDLSFNKSWIMATRMLQFIHNRRYDNPPPFLAQSVNADVKDVVWDHMAQAVQFIPRTKYEDAEPPKRASFHENWQDIQETWPDLIIGRRPPNFHWKCAVCASLADVHLSARGNKVISWEAIKPSELEHGEIAELPATADEIASWTCQVCWVAYRRPCVWIRQNDFVKTLIRQPSTYMYTLPSHPGLLPTLHQRPQAIQLPPALPEFDCYNLKGELDTDEDDASEQEENDEGEDQFGGVV